MQVDPAVRLARDRAADHVHDPHHPAARRAGRAHRLQRIGGFTRLRDGDRQRAGNRQVTAIAILGRVFDHDWYARQLFDEVTANQPRVPRRAACHDHDAIDAGARFRRELETVEARRPVRKEQATA